MRDKSACYLGWRRCENTATEGIDRPAWTISGLSPQPFGESEKSEAAAGYGLRSALFRHKAAVVGGASVRAGGLLARDVHFLQTCPAGFGGVYARTVCGFDKAAKEPEVFMEAMKRVVRPAKTNVDNKKAALRSMRRTA